MQRRKFWKSRYLYLAATILLVALIASGVSIIDNYHSASGHIMPSTAQEIENSYFVIAKLPGITVHASIHITASPVPAGNLTVTLPQNSTVASFLESYYNGFPICPLITVMFNSTSGSVAAARVNLGNGLNFTLDSSNPVYMGLVAAGNYPGLSPTVSAGQHYDLLIIQFGDVTNVAYCEVSR